MHKFGRLRNRLICSGIVFVHPTREAALAIVEDAIRFYELKGNVLAADRARVWVPKTLIHARE